MTVAAFHATSTFMAAIALTLVVFLATQPRVEAAAMVVTTNADDTNVDAQCSLR